MSTKAKGSLIAMVIFFIIYLILWFSIRYIFKNLNTSILSGITAAITVILSPQRRVIQTQSGEEVYLKWLFSKKIIKIKSKS